MAGKIEGMDVPRTLALRIALGAVAVLALAASGVGIVMSVKINWEFAQTLGRNPEAGLYLAATLASVEVARIMMPFVAKGLKLAQLRNSWAHWAFGLFTVVSIVSAFGYFALNRADSAAQRGLQVSLSKGFKAELDAVSLSLERNASVRAIGEIDADLKPLSRSDNRRAALEKERASAEQREKDRKRLSDLSAAHAWNVEIPSSKDAQTELIADTIASLPWMEGSKEERKAGIQRGVTVAIILATILALELLVGVTPFAAIMVLVWACRRPEDQNVPQMPSEGTDPSEGKNHRSKAFRSKSRKAPAEAYKDLLYMLGSGQEVPSQSWLADRWGWGGATVHTWLTKWGIEKTRLGPGRRNVIRPAAFAHVNGGGAA